MYLIINAMSFAGTDAQVPRTAVTLMDRGKWVYYPQTRTAKHALRAYFLGYTVSNKTSDFAKNTETVQVSVS